MCYYFPPSGLSSKPFWHSWKSAIVVETEEGSHASLRRDWSVPEAVTSEEDSVKSGRWGVHGRVFRQRSFTQTSLPRWGTRRFSLTSASTARTRAGSWWRWGRRCCRRQAGEAGASSDAARRWRLLGTPSILSDPLTFLQPETIDASIIHSSCSCPSEKLNIFRFAAVYYIR